MAEVIDGDVDVLHTAESVESMNKSLTHTLSMRRGGLKQILKSGAVVRDQNLFTELDTSKAISNQSEDANDEANTAEIYRQAQKTSQERRKLVIIMVGLPGRGKTYLCNKLVCYLDWCELAGCHAFRTHDVLERWLRCNARATVSGSIPSFDIFMPFAGWATPPSTSTLALSGARFLSLDKIRMRVFSIHEMRYVLFFQL